MLQEVEIWVVMIIGEGIWWLIWEDLAVVGGGLERWKEMKKVEMMRIDNEFL